MAATKSSPPATAKPSKQRQSVAELAPQLLALLPGKQSDLARAIGRKPTDGTVRRALQSLLETGAAKREGGQWIQGDELAKLPTPPDFDDAANKLHARTHQALVEQGTWRDIDVDLLERYVRRDMDARTFRAAVAEHGAFQTSGEGKRVYAHPGIDKERDANRDVQALADALVIPPDARKRHGRDGDDSGDDDELDF